MLVTGGASFIRSHLVDALIAAGLRVARIDNFATGPREGVNRAADVVEADIHDIRIVDLNAFDRVDTVFHVAALPQNSAFDREAVETH